MHDLEIECIDLLLGEEEDALGDAEYLVGGEGALQPQVLHHALAGLQYSHVRAVSKLVINRGPTYQFLP